MINVFPKKIIVNYIISLTVMDVNDEFKIVVVN